jgi:hypothetical protein
MIARSFRPVGWVAAVGAAALGCYMISLRVAAERAELDRLEARIIAASQQIRALQTELGTRGRMQQLEAWNEEVLALAAPVAAQFVEPNISLARFDVRQPLGAAVAEVRLAAATPAPAPQPPLATAPVPTPQRAVGAPAPVPTAPPPLVRRASVTIAPPRSAPAATTSRKRDRAVTAQPVRTASARVRPTPAGERAGLIDDRTMRALTAASRAERGAGTNN